MRGETASPSGGAFFVPFQSTPLTRGETMGGKGILAVFVISIHSPHTRGDRWRRRTCTSRRDFNPLPSYEGRPLCKARISRRKRFQSTPLTRGETSVLLSRFDELFEFQSTPLTRGETETHEESHCVGIISIHSPHTRGDPVAIRVAVFLSIFQSTPLIRGETRRERWLYPRC